jgi:tetratricopeptide (TPR) repeat protein
MSTYPGNVSLSNAVKERVVSTFQQALDLYKQGRTDEVVQGCGLILRMDPMFEPAKKLMEKARNPSAPINVDSLVQQLTADPMVAAREAMAARKFQKVIDLTTEVLTNDLMNEEARVMNEQAREKLEASPFVDQFVKKAAEAIASGDVAAARAGIDKIKSLDGDDTAVARLESELAKVKPKAAASPSFVVDNPAPAPGARGTAQASDFGFTFEEDKGGGQQPSSFGSFSFDSPFSTDTGSTPSITPPAGFDSKPAAPAQPSGTFSFDTPPPSPGFSGGFSFDKPAAGAPGAPATPGNFDFATASIETSPDDQKKIQQYLADGDRAFDGGDYQGAIDLWSRIFLIDVTNDLASERIDKAKKKKRESEQKGENLLASAIQAFESGDRNVAREKFNQVLKLDPNNSQALDYLARLEEVPVEGGATATTAPITPPESFADVFADDIPAGGAPLTPPPPPSPASAAPIPTPVAAKKPAAAKAKAAPAPSTGGAMRAIVAVVILAVLAGGGWYAWTKFMSKPKYDPAATEAIFRTATSLSQKGQYDAAIAMLQEVKSDDPQHDKALQMMADMQQKKSQNSAKPTLSSAAWQDALNGAKAAFDARDYDAAKKQFDAAARMKPLPPDMQALYTQASQQVAKLEGAKALFNEQRYQDALSNLQSLQQQDPQNGSIRRLIADAHFNLGAVDLQQEKVDAAAEEFGEVLKIDPNDELAKRSKALAERYNGQPKDLLYKIYVKYLPLRKAT